MKIKHTPGPWNVVCIEGLSDLAFLGVGSEKSTKAVCHIHFEEIIEDGNVSIPDECKANAKLIAAAPELLNQLLKSRELLVQNGFHTWSYVVIDIDSAIKKATE